MIKSWYRRLFSQKGRKDAAEPDSDRRQGFAHLGFHGDRHLLDLVDWLAPQVNAFIETGTNQATTTCYMAEHYRHLRIFTCEPDVAAWQAARERLSHYSQAFPSNQSSPEFLYEIHKQVPELYHQTNLYWLDAHGYGYRWPLAEEVNFITSHLDAAYVMIDDFRVPGCDDFAYEQYDGQVCEWETIAPALDKTKTYHLVYPAYREHTSPHHPLVGVGLIVFGIDDFALPSGLSERFTSSRVNVANGTGEDF